MYRVLLIRPERDGLSKADESVLLRLLTDAGFTLRTTPLGEVGEGTESLCFAFDGRPPHLLLVDLTAPASVPIGSLPLRHIQRLQREAWGEEAEPLPLIALMTSGHLGNREWFSFIDDFLMPPHAPDELVARIRFLLFRRQHIAERDVVRYQDLTLFISEAKAVGSDGTPIPLTPKEYALLRFLVTHRGRFYSRERLIDFVWGADFEGGPRTIDIHIRRLRMKLPPTVTERLENRRGVGYGFIGETARGK
ncbi:MAG: response regulator transcription factor [Capsulimonadales bacterium]|nr:response regulator transcription factor [Capsulimonadales bacterium]